MNADEDPSAECKQNGKKMKGQKNWNFMSHAHTTDMGVKSLNVDKTLLRF